MSFRRPHEYFFVALLFASVLLTLAMFDAYLHYLVFGGVLAVICRPAFRFLHRYLRSAPAAAFMTVIGLGLTVLVFLGSLVFMLYHEAAFLVSGLGGLNTAVLGAGLARLVPGQYAGELTSWFADSQTVTRSVAAYLTGHLPGFFHNLMTALVSFFVILISAYYFLRDGVAIKGTLMELSPMSRADDDFLFARLYATISAVVGGIVGVAIVKGILAIIFFRLCGMPQPVFWGVMTGLASFVPFIGVGMVVLGAAAYLLALGHVGSAVAVVITVLILTGNVDFVLQPFLVRRKVVIHPLLIVFSIFGGLAFFGPDGLLLGPVTLAVTLALLDVYKNRIRGELARAEAE